MFIEPEKRTIDTWGEGHFGASRGNRNHNGQDFKCEPNSNIFSSVFGVVTKIGYPYSNDLSFRYVEITDDNDYRHRVFYINPQVEVNDKISVGDYLGGSQKLGNRYTGITEHFHYEIMKIVDGNKKYFDPLTFRE